MSKFSRTQWAALSRHHSHPGTPNTNYSLLETSEHIDPPRRTYAHFTRFRTVPAPAALPAPAPAPHKLHTPAPTKSQPLPPLRHHPIGLPKCTCALSVAPNRCTNGTPPLQAGFAALVLAPAVTHCTFLIVIPATPFRQPTSTFQTKRRRFGNTITHCLTATAGNTRSAMCAAASTTRRVLHPNHTPRPLHEYATKITWPYISQRARANPCSRLPTPNTCTGRAPLRPNSIKSVLLSRAAVISPRCIMSYSDYKSHLSINI